MEEHLNAKGETSASGAYDVDRLGRHACSLFHSSGTHGHACGPSSFGIGDVRMIPALAPVSQLQMPLSPKFQLINDRDAACGAGWRFD